MTERIILPYSEQNSAIKLENSRRLVVYRIYYAVYISLSGVDRCEMVTVTWCWGWGYSLATVLRWSLHTNRMLPSSSSSDQLNTAGFTLSWPLASVSPTWSLHGTDSSHIWPAGTRSELLTPQRGNQIVYKWDFEKTVLRCIRQWNIACVHLCLLFFGKAQASFTFYKWRLTGSGS